MNFLAHILLSGTDDKIMIGNFIGDFVKGRQLDMYEEKVQTGIRLHRFIDTYTDTHPIVSQSKKRLRERFSHYAGVIVDVFYDHFIAINWRRYSGESLLVFTTHFYKKIQSYTHLPEKVSTMIAHMTKGNWLYHYQYIEGIDRALTGMAQRTQFDSGMEKAAGYLKTYYTDFESEFHQFFPDLQTQAAAFIKKEIT